MEAMEGNRQRELVERAVSWYEDMQSRCRVDAEGWCQCATCNLWHGKQKLLCILAKGDRNVPKCRITAVPVAINGREWQRVAGEGG